MNVLVTGSRGFIGKNLLKILKKKDGINIFEFTRNDTVEELEILINKSDFIFHLAGEVKPNSSDTELNTSNVTLTKIILKIIENNKRKIQILYTSSIHAELLKNEYGQTKRISEVLLENHVERNGFPCTIYRLPHVFGEGCKINYNSVISTWIYNSIHNLDITVYDREITMHYVYIQDIVKEFIEIMDNPSIVEQLYRRPLLIYTTTLGEVLDYLDEFKKNLENKSYIIENNDFKNKLYFTYLDYVKKEKN